MALRPRLRRWPQQLWSYFRAPDVSWARKGLMVLGALYLFTPLDLIPDALPLIGWLDDVGVLALIAMWLWKDVERHASAPVAVRS
ncbi:MAG TPA: DUF1232 domain-containing protein [Myxococcaceae bacterium]|nr:DUF1232 domain-containing protein [Myxococcaceae bacterium]